MSATATTTATATDPRLLQPSDYADIQRLVLRGTTMCHLRYHLFTVTSPVAGRRFIESFLTGALQVHSAGQECGREESRRDRPDHHLYLGVTYCGLEALALPTVSLRSFPTAFREGARVRAESLRNRIEDQDWKFNHDDTHIVVMLYASTAERLGELSAEIVKRAGEARCVSACLDGRLLPDLKLESGQVVKRPVHFGFRDGISQPQLLPVDAPTPDAPPPVLPGTFVLGHPDLPEAPGAEVAVLANEPLPLPTLMTKNGTYGAFLVMEQNCDAYEAFLTQNSRDAASRELLAARLCGRWQNGVPLALAPYSPLGQNGAPSVADVALNDFDYVSADDRNGMKCPIGAHVRRNNPRGSDVLGGMGGQVRLIRRGMPYGPPHDPKKPDGNERGMLGLFLCTSLKHQFEFVMRNWVNDGLFARGLDPAERDPLSGAQAPGATFTHRDADGKRVSVSMQSFVKVRGAAYLFFPSLTGLRIIAHTTALNTVPVMSERETADAPIVAQAIEILVTATKQSIGTGTHRDAHPKNHGLVKGWFEIDQNLPHELRVGLFGKPGRYAAYVRFSNGRAQQPDSVPDIRGMAIKLFDVKGPKASDDEEFTQDFILASHPVFFVPDVVSYLDFFAAPTEQEKATLFPEILKISIVIDNPLTTRYFSQTPYALGARLQVKYSVEPIDVEGAPPHDPVAATDPDYLRKIMAAHLRKADAKFAFFVQVAADGQAAGIDDATAAWTTQPRRVATLTIPKQEFDAPAQAQLAETISLSPWHCLLEHQPIGSINQARRRIYRETSKLRLSNQGLEPREPNGKTDF
jgi:deferrochelatase/peroxidase EfeB